MSATVVNETTSVTLNSNDTQTFTISAGPMFYQNDQALWVPVVYGDKDELAGNCQLVDIPGGTRLWKPNGKPPYNPAWLPTDYWLDVTDDNGVTDFLAGRGYIQEQVVLNDADSKMPAWRWKWNDNLTYSFFKGMHQWVSKVDGSVVFTKEQPSAWSQMQPDPKKLVTGTATIDADGKVTVDIDLSGLSYPIILDPTTTFNPSTDNRQLQTDGLASFAAARDAVAASTVVDPGATNKPFFGSDTTGWHYRGFMDFDTSTIDSGATVTAWDLQLYFTATDGAADGYTWNIATGLFTDIPAITTSWNDLAFVNVATDVDVSGITTSAYNTNSGVDLTSIIKAGTTKLIMIAGFEITNVAPTNYATHTIRATGNWAGGANPPILSVTSSVPGGSSKGIKKNMRSSLLLP